MKRALASIMLVVLLQVVAGPVFALTSPTTLEAALTKEERLLDLSHVVTVSDVARMEQLVTQIRAAGDKVLITRAELVLQLFRQRESSAVGRERYFQAIQEESNAIKSYRWQQAKQGVVKTSFWIGLASLGLLGLSAAAKSWALNRYNHSRTASAATPYFLTGRVSNFGILAGAIGTVGGLGLSWILEVNPFDIPAPRVSSAPVSFPTANMSLPAKISYVAALRNETEKRARRAVTVRKMSTAFLVAGIAGAVAAAATVSVGYLEARNSGATSPTSSTLQAYEYVALGNSALALVGLTGATVGYLFGPDPQALHRSVQTLDTQLQALRAQQ